MPVSVCDIIFPVPFDAPVTPLWTTVHLNDMPVFVLERGIFVVSPLFIVTFDALTFAVQTQVASVFSTNVQVFVVELYT